VIIGQRPVEGGLRVSKGKPTGSGLDEGRREPPSKGIREKARVGSMEEYLRVYEESIRDPEAFWARLAEGELEWFSGWDTVFEWDLEDGRFTWFKGGKLNASHNCLDRHTKGWRKNKAAIIWQGESEEDIEVFTYQQLLHEVCKFSNVLKEMGVKKGDRVSIYLPMIPELPIAMLACARIGAVHSIVSGGFSADSLRERIVDSNCRILITSDGGYRAGERIPLKSNADIAVAGDSPVEKVIVVKRTGIPMEMVDGRDIWWHEQMSDASPRCVPEQMDSEDPLFVLYTSGSTGRPKGVLHTTAGYLLYTDVTFKKVFDYREEDTFWCTADIGWITGHSYVVYGPLAAGATTLMFEGVQNYPRMDRFWQVVEKFKVTVFCTPSTTIRALMREGDVWPRARDLSSLRLLGSVGEAIDQEARMWYHSVIGGGRCPIVDTWLQTETGGLLIASLPGVTTLKPGAATRPFFGIEPAVCREDGTQAEVNEGGYLVIKRPWPSLMKTVDGQQQRFRDICWSKFPGVYLTGDRARIDEDGDIWLLGRVDDGIKVSGRRIGAAEVETALVSHHDVAEAAVCLGPRDQGGGDLRPYNPEALTERRGGTLGGCSPST